MTTAQIIAMVLVFVALIDAVVGYMWLLPKLRKDAAPKISAKLTTNKKDEGANKQKAVRVVRAAIDCWVVIALALAYFLWNNPNSF